MQKRWLVAVLMATVAIGLALTAASLLGFGFTATVAGRRLSARDPHRSFPVALIALFALLHYAPDVGARAASLLPILRRHRRGVAALALLTMGVGVLIVGVRYGSYVASAADSYGYITQAEAFVGRPAVTAEPTSLFDGWPDAPRTLTPLGYVLTGGTTVAPSYPPGLPLLMAAFMLVGGHAALYLLVPLSACVAVIATCALGARVGGIGTGLAAAFLLCCSPVFLFHTAVPMSDVPTTALWTLALVAAFASTRATALTTGLLAGTAVLVRPNLAPLLVPLAAIIALTESRKRRHALLMLGIFALGTLPALMVLLYLNTARYGSPFASGYGTVQSLFALNYFLPNLTRFTSWLLTTQTAFVFVGLAALVPAIARRVGDTPRGTRTIHLLLFYVLVVGAAYAFYLPFNSWAFLRFLLPALPLLLILAVAVTHAFVQIAAPRFAPLVTTSLVLMVALTTWEQAVVNGVLTNERSVRRFIDVPRYAAESMPGNAIFLTRLYSGSMRYYGGRPTIRWDFIAASSLDAIIDTVHRRGFIPYLIVEESEHEMFRTTFAAQRWGRLDWPPVAEYRGIEKVRVYDLGGSVPGASRPVDIIPADASDRRDPRGP